MNLLKSKLRRTTAVVAGSIMGLAGVVALAAPASAHAPSVTGGTPCRTADSWTVDWAIGNDYGLNATVSSIKVTDGAGKSLGLTGAITEAGKVILPFSSKHQADQVHGSTTVTDAKVDEAEITVVLVWTDGYTNDGKVTKNGKDHNGQPVTHTVHKPRKCPTPTPTTPGPTATPTIPPVTTPPATTPTPTPTATTPEIPVPTPSTTDEPGEFEPIVKGDCTTISIGMDNPANGLEWTLNYKTSKGEVREITVKPGEKKIEKFSAVPGFTVTLTISVTVEGKTYSDFTDIKFVKPADCDGGEGGGLPVTGAAAGGIAGGAAVLLAIGGALFFMARRRKVKFTA